jgi:hypothetical protein
MRACLGGWCTRRAGCEHYHAADRSEPAERLCVPGVDGTLRESLERRETSLLALVEEAKRLAECRA